MTEKIFVSYSHEDVAWLDRLQVHLAPLVRRGDIDLWSDRTIEPGQEWRDQIQRHLARSDVAVLLVSANFLASDFVADEELPEIVRAARRGDLTLKWIAVSASMYTVTELHEFQAVNDPSRPLDQLSSAEADQELSNAAKRILGARTLTEVSRALGVVDDVAGQLSSYARDEESASDEYSAVARHTGDHLVVESRSGEALERITAEDLARLDPEQRRLISALEKSMRNEFTRWTELYPRRRTLTAQESEVLNDSARRMCSEWQSILRFLDYIGKHLHDHYLEVEFVCYELVQAGP